MSPSLTPKMEYNEFEKVLIGNSVTGVLIFEGKLTKGKNSSSRIPVSFYEKGPYYAWFVNYLTDIPEDFLQIAEFSGTVSIQDDTGISFMFSADKIKVFRRGQTDCIIQIFDNRIIEKEQSIRNSQRNC